VGSIRRGTETIKELSTGLVNTKDYTVCSSSFFFTHGGVFTFDETKLSEAHKRTRSKFVWAIKSGTPLIIVNDMLSNFGQRAFYERVALSEGYEVDMRVLVDNEKLDLPQGNFRVYIQDGKVEIDVVSEKAAEIEKEPVILDVEVPVTAVG
jgi:hypothetical protein